MAELTYFVPEGYVDPVTGQWVEEGEYWKEYKMSEKAQFHVIKAFAGHNIGLHIDDGCMGAGEALKGSDFQNPLNWDSSSGSPNFKDDFYGDSNKFATNRHHIFHYVVFCDECKHGGNTDRAGRGGRTADYFVVCKKYATGDKEWKTFLHELGHNLEPSTKPSHLNGQGHHQIESCIMHATSWKGTDYCNTCWNSFSLSDCLK